MNGLANEKLLTVDEAASQLQIARRTVYRYIAAGRIAAVKHGGRTYVHHDQLHEYISRITNAGDVARVKLERAAKRAQRE